MNGRSGGDPAELADAQLATIDNPPHGSPPAPTPSRPSKTAPNLLVDQADAYRDLSSNLDHDDA